MVWCSRTRKFLLRPKKAGFTKVSGKKAHRIKQESLGETEKKELVFFFCLFVAGPMLKARLPKGKTIWPKLRKVPQPR